jgi:cytochrome P450
MRIEGETALNDDELVDVAIVLLIAGHETTANMLALGTFALLENPAQLEALRTHPEHMETAVEELLRFLSIVHTGPTRIALEDVDVGGVRVAKGETVLLSLPQVNRDEHQWPHPDDLDVTRPRAAHMAFGHGVHQCLGQQLARVEMRVGLSELLARLPNLRLAVPPEAVRLRTDMSVFGVHALPIAWG